jgi:hypothetical protein
MLRVKVHVCMRGWNAGNDAFASEFARLIFEWNMSDLGTN